MSYNTPFIFENNFFINNCLNSYITNELKKYNRLDTSFYDIDLIGTYRFGVNAINRNIFGLKYFLNFKNIQIVIMPVFVNAKIKREVFGTDYDRNGISARFENSYIQYKSNYFSVKYGRGLFSNDYYPHHSIIQSGLYPSYDEISFSFKINKFEISFSSGQLSNEKNIHDYIVTRNIGGHKIIYKLNEKNQFEIGEKIIYTGVNRRIEHIYLNPFIPFYLNGLESTRKSLNNDNDNSIVYANYKSTFNNKINFFTEIIIDDYQIDNTGKDHAVGVKIGLHNEKNKKISWLAEYTKINPWTYIHHGDYTSWEHRESSLGFPYGPDSKSFDLQSNVNINKYSFYCHFTYLEKGENNFFTEWNNISTDAKTQNISYYFFKRLSIVKKYKNHILEAGWSNFITPFSLMHSNFQGYKKGYAYLNFIYILSKSKKL